MCTQQNAPACLPKQTTPLSKDHSKSPHRNLMVCDVGRFLWRREEVYVHRAKMRLAAWHTPTSYIAVASPLRHTHQQLFPSLRALSNVYASPIFLLGMFTAAGGYVNDFYSPACVFDGSSEARHGRACRALIINWPSIHAP